MTSRSQSTGGGWSSSSDDEDNVLEEFSQHVSDSIDNEDNVVSDWCNREDINNLELLSTLQVSKMLCKNNFDILLTGRLYFTYLYHIEIEELSILLSK